MRENELRDDKQAQDEPGPAKPRSALGFTVETTLLIIVSPTRNAARLRMRSTNLLIRSYKFQAY